MIASRDACAVCGSPRALDVETETLKCARCQRGHGKRAKLEDEDERAPDSGGLPYWHNVT